MSQNGGRFVTPELSVLTELLAFLNLTEKFFLTGNEIQWSLNGEFFPSPDACCDALASALVEYVLEPGNCAITVLKTQYVNVTISDASGTVQGRGLHLADAILRALVSRNI